MKTFLSDFEGQGYEEEGGERSRERGAVWDWREEIIFTGAFWKLKMKQENGNRLRFHENKIWIETKEKLI